MLVHLFSSLPLFFYIPFFTHHRHTTIASVFVQVYRTDTKRIKAYTQKALSRILDVDTTQHSEQGKQ